MSELNHYGKDIDNLARDFMQAVTVAEKKVKAAEQDVQRAKNDPDRMTAQAELMRQQDALKKIKRDLPGQTMQRVQELRQALAADCDRVFAVNPDELDNNAMKVLERTTMMKPADYVTMYDKFAAAGNKTMCRVVADAAGRAADAMGENARNDPKYRTLRNVELTAHSISGADTMQKFDVLADCLKRTTNNTAMIPHWDELTAEIIENF